MGKRVRVAASGPKSIPAAVSNDRKVRLFGFDRTVKDRRVDVDGGGNEARICGDKDAVGAAHLVSLRLFVGSDPQSDNLARVSHGARGCHQFEEQSIELILARFRADEDLHTAPLIRPLSLRMRTSASAEPWNEVDRRPSGFPQLCAGRVTWRTARGLHAEYGRRRDPIASNKATASFLRHDQLSGPFGDDPARAGNMWPAEKAADEGSGLPKDVL